MNKDIMEDLREKVNTMMVSDDIRWEELLNISQKLDGFIVEYIKERMRGSDR